MCGSNPQCCERLVAYALLWKTSAYVQHVVVEPRGSAVGTSKAWLEGVCLAVSDVLHGTCVS